MSPPGDTARARRVRDGDLARPIRPESPRLRSGAAAAGARQYTSAYTLQMNMAKKATMATITARIHTVKSTSHSASQADSGQAMTTRHHGHVYHGHLSGGVQSIAIAMAFASMISLDVSLYASVRGAQNGRCSTTYRTPSGSKATLALALRRRPKKTTKWSANPTRFHNRKHTIAAWRKFKA